VTKHLTRKGGENMLSAEVRAVVSDFQEAVTKTGLGVSAQGTIFVHETLTREWIRRVLTDVLLSLVIQLGIEDSGVAVVFVEKPEDPEETLGDLTEELA